MELENYLLEEEEREQRFKQEKDWTIQKLLQQSRKDQDAGCRLLAIQTLVVQMILLVTLSGFTL